MARIFLSLVIILTTGIIWAQDSGSEKQTSVSPVFSWEVEEVDFGSIPHGVPVKAEFVFKNTGKTPLVLKDVRKSCGCTEVSFPREPIMPGKEGTISAQYDATDVGVFNKKLTVLANTDEGMHYLTIKGNVKERE